jgi:AcrR family transcriptional regulator
MSGSSTPKSKSKTQAWSDILPGRQEQHRLKKQAILETAAELIIEAGFQGASVNELARRLNVTKPTLYHYIPSKDDIALELLNLNFEAATLPHSEKVRTHLRELFRMVDVSARQFILEGIEDGSIKECDARWIDFLIFGALHWMTRWFHPENEQSASEVADNLFDIIEFGIAPRNKPADNPNP